MRTGFFSHAVWPLTKSEESSIKASEPKADKKAPSTSGVPRFAEPAEPEWPENLHGNKHVQWYGTPRGGGLNYQSPPEPGLLRNGFYISPKVGGSTYWAVKATIPDKFYQQGIDIGAATRAEHVADNLTAIFANKRNGLLPLPSKLYSGRTGQIVGDDYKWKKNEPAYRVTPVKQGKELYDIAAKFPKAATKARNRSLVWQALIDHTDAHPGNFFVPKGGKAEEGMWLIDHGGALTHDAMGLPKHHHSYNTWGASMEDHDILPGLFTLQSSKSENRPSGHELIDQARDIVDTYDANKGLVHSAFTHHPEADQHREIFAKRVDVLRRMIDRYGDDPKALEQKIAEFLTAAKGQAKIIGRPPTRNPNLPGESNNTVDSFTKSAVSGTGSRSPDFTDGTPAWQGKELEKLGYGGKPKEFNQASNFNTLIPYINPDGNIAHSGRFGDHGQFEVHLRPMTEKGDEYEGSGRKHPYLEWAGRKNWRTDLPQAGGQKFHSVLPHLFKEMIGHGYHGDNLHFDVLNPGTDAGDWRNEYFSDIANKWSDHVMPRIEGYTHTQTTLPGSESWGKSVALLFKALGEESRNQKFKDSSMARRFDSLPVNKLVPNSEVDDGHHGVFGENRGVYIQVSPSNARGENHENAGPKYPYIDWLQVRPGAKIGPEHVQSVFEALHRQGYDGDTMHFYAVDDHDHRTDANGLNRRDRLFRPLANQWKKFVATKQGESTVQKSAAWTRKEGQNPKGGLNAKGRASAKREGHNLKPPVKSGDNPRRASFLARMGGSPGPEHDEHGRATRLLLALQAWGASSKADAKRKAAAMSERLKRKKK